MPFEEEQTVAASEYETATELLSNLPEQTEPGYGAEVRRILPDLTKATLELLIDTADDISNSVRFNSFYALQVKLRRSHDYSTHRKNIERYRAKFQSQPMFAFMLAEYYGDVEADDNARDLAIRLARTASLELPNTPGVHHLLAEYLLESVELSSENYMLANHLREKLDEAESHVSIAISLSQGNYPKFYGTRGRIQSQLGLEDRAIKSVNIAIDLEDSQSADGRARILGYQAIRREIAQRRSARNFRNEQHAAIKEFRSLRTEVLSLLGLLAAVVAFISTATTLSINTTFPHSLSLLSASAAIIILVFLCFSLLFAKQATKQAVLVSLSTSILLFLLAFAFTITL